METQQRRIIHKYPKKEIDKDWQYYKKTMKKNAALPDGEEVTVQYYMIMNTINKRGLFKRGAYPRKKKKPIVVKFDS